MKRFIRKVDFYQCDPAGILFFANLFNLCHSAYEEMISDFALCENYFKNNEYVVPLLHCSADYKQPIELGEALEIEIRISKLLTHSFELEYNVFSKNCLKAQAKTVHIFISRGTGEKMNIPREIEDKLKLLPGF
jgi:YbgC/YbaW family acyl-CoA thioester hydrolase